MTITIDDGPSAEWRTLLQCLAEHKLRAHFFCLGSAMTQHREFANAALQAGHSLGNHGWSHKRYGSVPDTEFWDGILRTQTLIEQAYASHPEISGARHFRFPYGDSGHGQGPWRTLSRYANPRWWRGQQWLAQHGFTGAPKAPYGCRFPYRNRLRDRDWFWSLDTEDWNPARHDRGLQRLQHALETHTTPHVVLLHDHESTLPHTCALLRIIAAAGIDANNPCLPG